MRFVDIREKNIEFRKLMVGEVFLYEGNLFMQVRVPEINHENFAVKLTGANSGNVYFLSTNEKVELIDSVDIHIVIGDIGALKLH